MKIFDSIIWGASEILLIKSLHGQAVIPNHLFQLLHGISSEQWNICSETFAYSTFKWKPKSYISYSALTNMNIHWSCVIRSSRQVTFRYCRHFLSQEDLQSKFVLRPWRVQWLAQGVAGDSSLASPTLSPLHCVSTPPTSASYCLRPSLHTSLAIYNIPISQSLQQYLW